MTSKYTKQIDNFDFGQGPEKVRFVETIDVSEGVECDVYTVDKDKNKDLGIIKIKKGFKTPKQKVLKGKKTIEGYISGKGKLTITRQNGLEEIYEVDDSRKTNFKIDVGIGDIMQWQADPGYNLIAFEICVPPYKDGRYENLE